VPRGEVESLTGPSVRIGNHPERVGTRPEISVDGQLEAHDTPPMPGEGGVRRVLRSRFALPDRSSPDRSRLKLTAPTAHVEPAPATSGFFARLGGFVVRHPWWVIGVWAVAAAVIIATAPSLPTATEESDFLPSHYESIKALKLRENAFPAAFSPSVVVVAQPAKGGKLSSADNKKVEEVGDQLRHSKIGAIEGVQDGETSSNKLVQTIGVELPEINPNTEDTVYDAVKELRNELKPLEAKTGLTLGTTGSAAESYDVHKASGDANAITAFGTIILIILLLLIIFRSPTIAFLPIVVILVVSGIANGLIADIVKAFGLKTDSSVSSLLIVVLFGVGTDYILFLLFRYRERLRLGDDRRTAMVAAVGRVGEAIASAATVVIIAFLAMTLSSLSFFRSLGPSLAIAVAVTLLAGLTLVPAIVSLLGPKIFWPSKSWKQEPKGARFTALGNAMSRRPAVFAGVSGVVLILLAVAALGFHPSFDLASGSTPSDAESRVALKALEQGLPPGATDPTSVFLQNASGKPLAQSALTTYRKGLEKVEGVGSVGPATLSKDHATAEFSVTLADSPESDGALATVRGPLRETAHNSAPSGATALVGGITSVYVDIDKAMNRDYSIVFPVAAILIMIVLGLLLRSLIAPIYLMISVGLGFAATLGATTLVFQDAGGKSGLIFILPLVMYMFVVALGTDYNILMMSRLREEATEGLSPRDALAMAIRHTGPTVASAGVILAGSFAVLMLAGNALLAEIGFAIAFGIAVAAFVMAMLFTPSLTALIGRLAWWPGHGDRRSYRVSPEPEPEPEPD
jgi:putative drug exporter of the RND superfamily